MTPDAKPESADKPMPHRSKSRGPVLVLLGVAVLLALYVLSMGPAARMLADSDPPPPIFSGARLIVLSEAWHGLYAPLFWTGRQWGAFEKAIQWYIELWMPDDGPATYIQ